MFGEILKNFRQKKGLTQIDIVSVLHLAHSGFDNVDNVTVSRWERGITKPTLVKKIRILRILGIDVSLLINHLDKERLGQHHSFHNIRFNAFEGMPKNALYSMSDEVIEESCLHTGFGVFKMPIRAYLENTHERQFVDAFSLKNKEKIESVMYTNNTQQVLGHFLYFHIHGVNRTGRYISPEEMVTCNKFRECSIFIFSMYSENPSIYEATLRHISTQLIRNNNIKYIYIFCKWKEAKKHLNHIGAEPFYYIDAQRMIVRVEVALWLSQAEVISALRK